MNPTKARELLSLAGSIASITGVSLLWLKSLAPQAKLAVAIPIYFVASLLGVGVIALAYIVFSFGYEFLIQGSTIPRVEPSAAAKVAYAGLVGGVLLIVTGIAVFGIFFIGWDTVQALGEAVSK